MFGKAFQKGFADGFLSPFTFFLPPEKAKRKTVEYKEYKPVDLPDVSVAAAWRKVGALLEESMKAEGEKSDAERRRAGRETESAEPDGK